MAKPQPEQNQLPVVARLRIRYAKRGPMRFTSHRDFARAFEHYLLVRNRAGDWPGLRDHVDRLLYEEGSAALADNDDERGLRLLRELYERRPDYEGLLDKLARSYAGRIERAFRERAFPDGRRILHELADFAPNHPATATSRALFVDLARSHADRAGVFVVRADDRWELEERVAWVYRSIRIVVEKRRSAVA